jgi:two-component system, NarL family, nitrate/nitrite response regulator NarP
MIKVFLIDDQPATRAVLRLRLELEADLVVVGESGNDHDTVTQVRALAPDVVILDAVTIMLDMGPASALLRELALGWVVVVLTLHDDAATRGRALAAGARHVVSKHGVDGLLLAAIRAAAVPSSAPGSAL